MIVVLARVDERLIHGQIMNQWTEAISVSHILIVDEELAQDRLMSNIYRVLAPLGLDVQAFSSVDAARYLKTHEDDESRVILLAKTPQPFERLVRLGIPLQDVILADKIYYPNKLILPQNSKYSINWLLDNGVKVNVQNFPSDEPQPVSEYKLK